MFDPRHNCLCPTSSLLPSDIQTLAFVPQLPQSLTPRSVVALVKNPHLRRPSPCPCPHYPLHSSPRSYSQSLLSLHLCRPCLHPHPLHLHLLPTMSPQLLPPLLLLQSRHPSLAPSFTQLTQLPVSSLVLTPPPLPCPLNTPSITAQLTTQLTRYCSSLRIPHFP